MKTQTNIGSTDAEASMDEIHATTTKLTSLRKSMKVLVPLSEAERAEQRSRSFSFKKLRTLKGRLSAARQHRELLPPAFDMAAFERDATQALGLSECLAVLEDLARAIGDTLMVVGTRAHNAGAAAYAHIKVASATAPHLAGTVETIASRASRSAPKGTEPSEVPKPEEPALTQAPVESPAPSADKAA